MKYLFLCFILQIPSAPPVNEVIDNTTSPLIERSQNVLFKFLPQLSQSVFGNMEETMMLKPCSASGTPSNEARPHETEVPIVVQEQPKNVKFEPLRKIFFIGTKCKIAKEEKMGKTMSGKRCP